MCAIANNAANCSVLTIDEAGHEWCRGSIDHAAKKQKNATNVYAPTHCCHYVNTIAELGRGISTALDYNKEQEVCPK